MEYAMNLPMLIGNILLLAVVPAVFGSIILEPKLKKSITFLITFIVCSAPIIWGHFNEKLPAFISGNLCYVVTGILAFTLFKDSKTQKLIFSGAWILIVYFSSLSIEGTLYALGIIDGEKISDVPAHIIVITLILESLLASCLLLILTALKKKMFNKQDLGKWVWTFLFFPISQLVLMFAIIVVARSGHLFLSYENRQNIPSIVIIIAVIVSILADVSLFIAMSRNAKNERLKKELEFQEYKNEMNLEYYKSLEQDSTETRKIKHDLNNMIQVVSALFYEGGDDSQEKAENLFSEMKEALADLDFREYTSNPLINVIVANKTAQCKKENITLNANINIAQELNIHDIDICRAFTNLLDNAIKATKSFTDKSSRSIELSSFVEDGYFYLKTKNQTEADDNEKKKRSGYGLKIMQDLADKYEGSFITKNEGNEFSALLTLKILNKENDQSPQKINNEVRSLELNPQ